MKDDWTDTPSPVPPEPHAMSKEAIAKEIGKEIRRVRWAVIVGFVFLAALVALF